MTQDDLHTMVDLQRYPINTPDSSAYRHLVEDARERLRTTQSVQLHGFLRPPAIEAMVDDVLRCREQFDTRVSSANAYFSSVDTTLPETHPVRITQEIKGSSLCRDRMPSASALQRLFESDALLAFVRDVMGKRVLYRHADPMNAVLVLISKTGESGLWHFDSNEVSVTILLNKPVRGGQFEYVPNLRSDTEQNFAGVSDILRGGRQGVRTVEAYPGTLQIFTGRHSLHHVTAVEGAEERIVMVLGYADEPNKQSSKRAMLELYGRCHPLHEEAAGRSSL